MASQIDGACDQKEEQSNHSNNNSNKESIPFDQELYNSKTYPISFWSMSLPSVAPPSTTTDRQQSSFFIVKSDDVSSVFDKRPRLPFLIQFNNILDDEQRQQVSMPAVGAEALEKPLISEELAAQRAGQSLPVDAFNGLMANPNSNVSIDSTIDEVPESAEPMDISDQHQHQQQQQQQQESCQTQKPTEPQQAATEGHNTTTGGYCGPMTNASTGSQNTTTTSKNQAYSSIGDSLIDLIIKLKDENKNLAIALETNNKYVRERLCEIKKIHELAQSNEKQFTIERLEYQSQINKLKRQNNFLSDRLKSLEAQKRTSSQSSGQSLESCKGTGDDLLSAAMDRIYPMLDNHDSFSNDAYTRSSCATGSTSSSSPDGNELKTIQESPTMEATDEMSYLRYNPDKHRVQPTAPPMSVSSHQPPTYPKQVTYGNEKWQSVEDPMKQCDKLEQKLNDIGKKDYEITLLQNQLNIYRQDFRFERIANLEAQLQIEKLKNDIDRLCLERLQQKSSSQPTSNDSTGDDHHDIGPQDPYHQGRHHRGSHSRRGHRHHHYEDQIASGGVSGSPGVIGKLGSHLGKRALKHAAKAAKKAQIHAAKMESEQQIQAASRDQLNSAYPTRRINPASGMVNGLFSTANRAVLTGYKYASNMASAQVDLAMEKFNQYEQPTSSSSSNTNNRPPAENPHCK